MSAYNGWTGELTYPAGEYTLHSTEPQYIFQINGRDANPLVSIKPDGTIEFGEGYHPDEAAKIFWEAIAYHSPLVKPRIVEPTPWAVICPHHDRQYLTGEQYDSQMMAADSYWFCPICGDHSEWDNDNFETFYFGDDHGEKKEA